MYSNVFFFTVDKTAEEGNSDQIICIGEFILAFSPVLWASIFSPQLCFVGPKTASQLQDSNAIYRFDSYKVILFRLRINPLRPNSLDIDLEVHTNCRGHEKPTRSHLIKPFQVFVSILLFWTSEVYQAFRFIHTDQKGSAR